MKTLSKNNGLKKLAKLNINKTSIAYKVVSELLGYQVGKYSTYMVMGNEIRPVYTSGSKRFISNQDHTRAIKEVLNKIGIEFIFTNDSPRGGLTGNLITIITKIK